MSVDDREPARRLARWYRRAKRDLPWRRTDDPYAIWISETMLQQTTVATVAPRWERFLRRFPSVEALAAADLEDVLAEWSGLGYYARARNLHAAAKLVAAGGFPRTEEGWRELPGVGAYTAAAIASIAFGARAAVVDGNVVRVLCRRDGLSLDPKAPSTRRRIAALAAALLPARGPGEHNQALMELGAVVCLPRAPRCPLCPWRASCAGARSGDPGRFPAAARRPAIRNVALAAGLAFRRGRIVLVSDRVLVAGHAVPPLALVKSGRTPRGALAAAWPRETGRALGEARLLGVVRHAVLDRRYTVTVFAVSEGRARGGGRPRLVDPTRLDGVPHGGLLRKALALWLSSNRWPEESARKRPGPARRRRAEPRGRS